MISLATAVPKHVLGQDKVSETARHIFGMAGVADLDRMVAVFGNAGIACRYSTVPVTWYEEPHGWTDRNTLYLEHALALIEEAAHKALAKAGLETHDIDAVVVVSTTGIATPSLDAMLLNRLPLRSDVMRLPIFGLGCAGGVLGLSRAADLARANPKARILFLVVELCMLCFRHGDFAKSNLVATALFGDGAAAAILSCDGDGPALLQGGEFTWPNSLDIMGWDVADDGLKAIFSRDIPALVQRDLRAATESFLARHDLRVADIDYFVCHPGGAKVLDALEEAFTLAPGALAYARETLRDYGNMSAATVLFVLDRVLRSGASGRMLMTALGPGFTAGFQLLDA
ncbi:MAG TPA: 3-oxoacyl-[acyl-carrier-protein] synthase III C-terminal domain-containing protein [Stellaceae bacterium]|nr:3-oxoacyl-[acyl-carrier-protein] synthase III C-terminal domain-containing protein [Stellaceae bacterium]